MSSNDFQMMKSSMMIGADADYVDALYESYLEDAQSVSPEWRNYFSGIKGEAQDIPHAPIREKFLYLAQHKAQAVMVEGDAVHERKQSAVHALIRAYRQYGHTQAQLDPLGMMVRPAHPELNISYHGLVDADLDTTFETGFHQGMSQATLREILAILKHSYTETVAFEYMHLNNQEEVAWLQARIEQKNVSANLTPEARQRVLSQLTAAEGLERYLHTRFVGQKRFSLEGGDALIPLLDEIIMRAGETPIREIIMGMAHRGRLNVLVNLLGKSPAELFDEFEGKHAHSTLSSGDVKYHQGFSSDVKTRGKAVHLALSFNPSHLEIVCPVVEGSVRARQDRRRDNEYAQVLPILIHGDAAFAGQGVVMETLNMSQTRAYKTGGSVHIVVNNQVGFTTSNPQDARSTPYCTDIAKMILAPIIHVNGDDPDAVLFVAQLALDYRVRFAKDIVIDLVCYRRHGHNEADEPSATQPLMYQKIRAHKTVREMYAQKLVSEGLMSEAEADALVERYRTRLDAGENIVTHLVDENPEYRSADWAAYRQFDQPVKNTGINKTTITRLGEIISTIPETIKLQSQIAKTFADRQKMAKGEIPMDWGFAENLAYATLLDEGYDVRITGQDVGRGTFAHRHAVLHDQVKDDIYIPLDHVKADRKFTIRDSFLSEEAVLAFEYGYSTTDPNTMVIWEAQFGDFVNGAQVVIDQFISSGEQKWGRYSGLAMFLPHGYEGMGPEHSSARLERFLQLCAEHNIQVCTPTTPAQAFHMIRRQMLQPYRRPLIVMTPKSLLRHRLAVSTFDDLTQGTFQTLIPEIDDIPAKDVTRVVLCGGKVYYDLLQKRRDNHLNHIAIIRIEQLYPFPEQELRSLLAQYTAAKTVVWCQEEPRNQGAWYCSSHHMQASLATHQHLIYAGRDPSASPAAGYHGLHVEQQTKLVADALELS